MPRFAVAVAGSTLSEKRILRGIHELYFDVDDALDLLRLAQPELQAAVGGASSLSYGCFAPYIMPFLQLGGADCSDRTFEIPLGRIASQTHAWTPLGRCSSC